MEDAQFLNLGNKYNIKRRQIEVSRPKTVPSNHDTNSSAVRNLEILPIISTKKKQTQKYSYLDCCVFLHFSSLNEPLIWREYQNSENIRVWNKLPNGSSQGAHQTKTGINYSSLVFTLAIKCHPRVKCKIFHQTNQKLWQKSFFSSLQ